MKKTHTELVDVLDSETNKPVPADGLTIGEIVVRSNTIMKGYHKNRKATEDSLADGFLRSGDLAVRHQSGYVEIKDRLKDYFLTGISAKEIFEHMQNQYLWTLDHFGGHIDYANDILVEYGQKISFGDNVDKNFYIIMHIIMFIEIFLALEVG